MRMRHFAHSKKSVYFIMTQNSNTVAMKCQKAPLFCASATVMHKTHGQADYSLFLFGQGEVSPCAAICPKVAVRLLGQIRRYPLFAHAHRQRQIKGIRNPKASHAPPEIRQFTMSVPWRASFSLNATRMRQKKRARCALFRNFKTGLAYWRGFKIS